MRAEEIVDEESFETFLSRLPGATRYDDAVTLASRSVLRVFPIWVRAMPEAWARKENVSALSIARIIVRLLVATKRQDYSMGYLASYPSSAARAFDTTRAVGAANVASSAESATYAARCAAFSLARARSDTRAASRADADAVFAAAASADAANKAAASVSPDATFELRAALRAEYYPVRKQLDIISFPLWKDSMPAGLKPAWHEGRDWMQANPGHTFWVRWYEAILAGRPLTGDWDSHWQLLHDIALIPDADWEKGAKHVAGLIEKIERPFALKMTDSNERVVVNPDTQRLMLEPIAPLQDDFSSYVRRKLTKALKVFGPNPGNQYTALLPELSLLAGALEDADNLPVELYDTCMSITRRLAARINTGELPAEKDDALLGDFLNRIRETGAEIFAEDPETQKAIERRKRIEPNAALVENTEALRLVAEEIAKRSDPGPLARLPDALDAVSDPNRSAEEKHAESVKFAGRVLRVFKVCSAIVGGGAATGLAAPVATKEAIEAYRWLATDPAVQQAYRIILQFLGLA